jgi:hypothetical protein
MSSSKKPAAALWSPSTPQQREFWLKMKKEEYQKLAKEIPAGISQATKAIPHTSGLQPWCISVVVSDIAYSPTWGSHWGLALHPMGQSTGFLLHAVIAIGETLYTWHVEGREGDQIFYGAEGHFWIAQIDSSRVRLVMDIMKKMAPPNEQGMQCQDYVIATVLQLELAGLVQPGMFNSLLVLREHDAEEMKAAAKNQWTSVSWKGPA